MLDLTLVALKQLIFSLLILSRADFPFHLSVIVVCHQIQFIIKLSPPTMGCCESLLDASWKTYFPNRPLSPLIDIDKLLVLLPFHCVVVVFTEQRRQRDFQSRETFSILTVGRPVDAKTQNIHSWVYWHKSN